jgi:hypothetical protein
VCVNMSLRTYPRLSVSETGKRANGAIGGIGITSRTRTYKNPRSSATRCSLLLTAAGKREAMLYLAGIPPASSDINFDWLYRRQPWRFKGVILTFETFERAKRENEASMSGKVRLLAPLGNSRPPDIYHQW